MTHIAVVILNWNGRHYLEKFLPSVCKYSDFPGTEIIVADNGSSDNSIQFLKQHYPAVRLIEFKTNFGFASGYHQAIQLIDAEFLVLLNSDVEVTSGWLKPLAEAMQNEPEMGACMPKILAYDRKDHFEYAGACGGYIDRFGYPFCRGRILNVIEKDEGQYDSLQYVFWATGACMMIRSEAYKSAGGLDGDFFAHMEEIDLCWRLHRIGYRIAVIPSSQIYHVGGGTLPNNTPRKLYLNYRNNLYMLFKNLPRFRVIPVMFVRMALDGASAFTYLAKGSVKFFFAVMQAHFDFYLRIPKLIRLRRKLNIPAKPGLIDEIYPGSIVFQFFVKKKRYFSELDW